MGEAGCFLSSASTGSLWKPKVKHSPLNTSLPRSVCYLTLSQWKHLRSRAPRERLVGVFTIRTQQEVSQCGISGVFLKVNIRANSISPSAGEGGRAWLCCSKPRWAVTGDACVFSGCQGSPRHSAQRAYCLGPVFWGPG